MRAICLIAAVLFCVSSALLAVEPRPPRSWKLSGEDQAELALARVDDGSVELQRSTGETLIVALDALSDEDRRYVAAETELIWARIVLDPEVMSPLTLQLIELFGSSANGADGPFAQGVAPMQMGGQQGLSPARLAEKFGAPQRRTMDAGEEKGVEYIVYGPIAVGAKEDDDRGTWLRVDRKLAADGLKKRAQAALGITPEPEEPRTPRP
jgi:hypothetical protein